MNPLDTQLLRRNSDPAAIISSVIARQQLNDNDNDIADDQPLDFSKPKKRSDSSTTSGSLPRSDESNSPHSPMSIGGYFSPSSASSASVALSTQQMNRPSVITCAPALRTAAHHATKLASPGCRKCVSSSLSSPVSPGHRHHAPHTPPPPPYSAFAGGGGGGHQERGRLVISESPERVVVVRNKTPPVLCDLSSDPMIDEHVSVVLLR